MNRIRRAVSSRMRLICTAAAALLLIAMADSVHAQSGAAAREWNQDRGNASRTGIVDVEPVRGEPSVAWSVKLPGKPASDPVTWGGVVFVASEEFGRRRLHAFRILTGEELGRARNLGRGGVIRLATSNGTVIVAEEGRYQGFAHNGTKFGLGWNRKISGLEGVPCVHDGKLYAVAKEKLQCIDARSGRVLSGKLTFQAQGALSVAPAGYGDSLELAGAAALGDAVHLVRMALERVESKRKSLAPGPERIGLFGGDEDDASFLLTRIAGGKEKVASWYIAASGVRLLGEAGSFGACVFGGDANRGGLSIIVTEPAVHDGSVYGFDKEGSLISMNARGQYGKIVPGDKLPSGAKPGPASGAGGVLYLGNWALQIGSGRVLWSVDDLEAASPAIPAGDGRIVMLNGDGDLVCLVDPKIATAGADKGEPTARSGGGGAAGGGASAAGAGPPEAPPAPRDLPSYVLLADGRQVDGTFEVLAGGSVQVTPRLGDPFTVPLDDVAVGVRDASVVVRGEEAYVLEIWRRSIRLGFARALDDLFADFASRRLFTACRRLLADAREYGLSPARAEHLEREIAGKADHSNAERIATRLAPREDEIRKKCHEEFLKAAATCRSQGFPAAAAVLLFEAGRVVPGDPRTSAEAEASIPDGFPWKNAENAGGLWMLWARELVPAGGRFLEPGAAEWKRLKGPIWSEGVIGIRTRNLLCFSREKNPEVVGACLRNGEGAIRALRYFFGKKLAEADRELLELRIFDTREAYLAEQKGEEDGAAGGVPLEFSGGYYSPQENISRFFIPRDGKSGQALGRGLYKVVAHELTHHFIERCLVEKKYRGRTRADIPGFWVVEGIARFIEDQAVEMVRHGMRFDDVTVSSVDATVELENLGELFDPHKLLEMSYLGFSKLDPKPTIKVRLRNTLATYLVSRFGVYYEESGTLVFYLLNRRGDKGREALLEYLRDFYRGKIKKGSWKRLGFTSAAALDREFREFLSGLRGE